MEFVKRKGTVFTLGEQPYFYMGTNLWYGVNLAAENPARLLRELDRLVALGITNIRILGTSQGPDSEPWRMKPAIEQFDEALNTTVLNETYLIGMDLLLSEAGKRGIHTVIMLNNFWQWSGGFAQYVHWFLSRSEPIPYPANSTDGIGYQRFMNYSERFYTCEPCIKRYIEVAKLLVNRVNTFTKVAYKDDPTIMAWQVANEPFPVHSGNEAKILANRTCNEIKSVDSKHLFSIGSTGRHEDNYDDSLALDCVDYGTFHVWAQNAGWYDPKRSEETYKYAIGNATENIIKNVEGNRNGNRANIKKPLVLEEFGLARDFEGLFPENATTYKDGYYEFIFHKVMDYAEKDWVSGVNFWAWAGEGRPNRNRANHTWQLGDEWIGDPPHEPQGWYSVFDTDSSTKGIISKYATQLSRSYEISDHSFPSAFWVIIMISLALVLGGIAADRFIRKPKKETAAAEGVDVTASLIAGDHN